MKAMRTTALLFALLACVAAPLTAQEAEAPEGAVISTAHVTGFDLAELSPGLQEEIAELAGAAVDRRRLREIAARIEAEQPRYLAAARAVQDPDGEVRVIFVVAPVRARGDEANVNARYIIEDVAVSGPRADDLSPDLRDSLDALVGQPLGSDAAEEVEDRLRKAFPDHHVRRRIARGSRSGHIRLTFAVDPPESQRWLRFQSELSKVVYHSKQGWGAHLDMPIGGRDFRVTPIIAISNADDLVEEYSGFGLRFESRRLGTERLGASFEWTAFDASWQPETLAAIAAGADVPGAYDDRTTITPRVTFAITQDVSVSGGVSITELDPLVAPGDGLMASAALFSVRVDRRWPRSSDATHSLQAGYSLRAGLEGLESDFEYRRHLAEVFYQYRYDDHRVLASAIVGGITGEAPLFERFALGDSQTLRGWNKYDIAPVGGERMFHTSLEYRYHGVAAFLDAGSVWDSGAERRVRVAAGGGLAAGPLFVTVGFPLNTDDLGAIVTLGLRFSRVGVKF